MYSIVCLKGREGMGCCFRWRRLGSLRRVTLKQRPKKVLVHWVSPLCLEAPLATGGGQAGLGFKGESSETS